MYLGDALLRSGLSLHTVMEAFAVITGRLRNVEQGKNNATPRRGEPHFWGDAWGNLAFTDV